MEALFSKCWLSCRLTTDGATLVGEFSVCQESLKSGTASSVICRQGDWAPTGTVDKSKHTRSTFTTMLSAKLGTSHRAAKGKEAVYLVCKALKKMQDMTKETVEVEKNAI